MRSVFFCFCALSLPLSLPIDATKPLSVLSPRRHLADAFFARPKFGCTSVTYLAFTDGAHDRCIAWRGASTEARKTSLGMGTKAGNSDWSWAPGLTSYLYAVCICCSENLRVNSSSRPSRDGTRRDVCLILTKNHQFHCERRRFLERKDGSHE